MRRRVIQAALAAACVTGVARAEAPAPLENPVVFVQMFRWTFQLDICGDTQMADMLRKAINEKVESCPFTDAAKLEFRRSALETDLVLERVRRGMENKESWLADARRPGGACADASRHPGYQQYRQKLQEYVEGRISFDAVIIEPCDKLPDDQ